MLHDSATAGIASDSFASEDAHIHMERNEERKAKKMTDAGLEPAIP